MNWINSVVRPKIRGLLTTTTKREPPDDFWKQCPSCGQMLDHKALEDNLLVFPCCEHHTRVGAEQRLKMVFDGGHYEAIKNPDVPLDPLKFRDIKRYTDRLKAAKADTGLDNAVLVAKGKLKGRPITAAAQDFRFMGGSLGMAAGEAVVTGMMHAVEHKTPFILFAASGGARMQEGILSLMQMPRTTIAIQALRAARLPYIVVLTDPTTGGVTASYAMLGDIQIAEPGALICFAGPRVIEQTIREQLPDGFQRAEYLLSHGMIDMVVERKNIKQTLSRLCTMLMSGAESKKAAPAEVRKDIEKSDDDVLITVNGLANGSAAVVVAKEHGDEAVEIVVEEPAEISNDDKTSADKTEAKTTKTVSESDGAEPITDIATISAKTGDGKDSGSSKDAATKDA